MNHIVHSVFALTALVTAAGASAAEPATYRCERLFQGDNVNAHDINDRGVVAGAAPVRKEGWYPAIWRQRSIEKLPQVAGFEGATNVARAINRKGTLAGSVNDQGYQLAALWIDGVGTTLPAFANAAVPTSEAVAINDRGHAVGYSTNSRVNRHAALWKNGKVIDLGALESQRGAHKTDSRANAINASGMVVGVSEGPTSYRRAVQWTDGTRASLVDLGATAFGTESEAMSVNADGVVVGFSTVGHTSQPYRPIGWIGGVAFDLKPVAGAESSVAKDINDAGTVVGSVDTGDYGAVVWPHYHDEPVDLNTRLDANGCHGANGTTYRLTHGIAVSNNGEILAAGTAEPGSYSFESFRLTPVSRR